MTLSFPTLRSADLAGGQPMVFALGDDNRVDEFDVERPADVAQEFGDANVAVARGRVTAWMIMDQQDSRRVQFEARALGEALRWEVSRGGQDRKSTRLNSSP